ncbi:MAG TPA: SdrD B-like domain-containing protein [Actinomycetes bacterium]|nr:SdrD B-like domain-containing protein [Actinomycetes bacterium]
MLRRRSLRGVAAVAISAAVLVGAAAVPSVPAVAASDVVSGYVYRDLDNDGVRDAGELGVRGVVIRSGRNATITDSSGFYAFSGVTAPINLRADSGWFRTQCEASYSGPSSGSKYTAACPDPGAGAGADQQFRVINQLLSATASPGQMASLGVTPDWAGEGYAGYSTDPAAANSVDPALRISPGYRLPGAEVDCQNAVCRPGETQWSLTQWMNQGTTTLKRLHAVITAPSGSSITHVAPYYGHGAGSAHAITGYEVVDATTGNALSIGVNGELSQTTSRIKVILTGQLLPGSEYLTDVAYRVADDATFSDGNLDGVPDCDASTGGPYPGQTCDLATDSAPGSYITYGAVIKMRPRVDVDAEFCPAVPDNCPVLGVHNKTLGGDSNDSAAWKVDSPFPPS